MAVTTQPTVRTPTNSAGTSLMTMRWMNCPPPRSSPLQPTSCFTPPCDGAVEQEEETLRLGSDAQASRFSMPFKAIPQLWGPGAHSGGLTCVCEGHCQAGDNEMPSAADWRTLQADCAVLQQPEGPVPVKILSNHFIDNLKTQQMLLLLSFLHLNGCAVRLTDALNCCFCCIQCRWFCRNGSPACTPGLTDSISILKNVDIALWKCKYLRAKRLVCKVTKLSLFLFFESSIHHNNRLIKHKADVRALTYLLKQADGFFQQYGNWHCCSY